MLRVLIEHCAKLVQHFLETSLFQRNSPQLEMAIALAGINRYCVFDALRGIGIRVEADLALD